MTDYDTMMAILNNAKQPHFEYTQIGQGGNVRVVVLDEKSDGARYVPLLYFDLDTNAFVEAGVRYIDP